MLITGQAILGFSTVSMDQRYLYSEGSPHLFPPSPWRGCWCTCCFTYVEVLTESFGAAGISLLLPYSLWCFYKSPEIIICVSVGTSLRKHLASWHIDLSGNARINLTTTMIADPSTDAQQINTWLNILALIQIFSVQKYFVLFTDHHLFSAKYLRPSRTRWRLT